MPHFAFAYNHPYRSVATRLEFKKVRELALELAKKINPSELVALSGLVYELLSLFVKSVSIFQPEMRQHLIDQEHSGEICLSSCTLGCLKRRPSFSRSQTPVGEGK
jgi:hypothetical protein